MEKIQAANILAQKNVSLKKQDHAKNLLIKEAAIKQGKSTDFLYDLSYQDKLKTIHTELKKLQNQANTLQKAKELTRNIIEQSSIINRLNNEMPQKRTDLLKAISIYAKQVMELNIQDINIPEKSGDILKNIKQLNDATNIINEKLVNIENIIKNKEIAIENINSTLNTPRLNSELSQKEIHKKIRDFAGSAMNTQGNLNPDKIIKLLA